MALQRFHAYFVWGPLMENRIARMLSLAPKGRELASPPSEHSGPNITTFFFYKREKILASGTMPQPMLRVSGTISPQPILVIGLPETGGFHRRNMSYSVLFKFHIKVVIDHALLIYCQA